MRFSLRTICSLALPALLLVIAACSNSSTPETVTGKNFSVNASVTTLTIKPGATDKFSVEAVASNGFNSSVSVVIGGLQAGVSVSPSALTLTPGVAQTVTVTAASSATPGDSTITITGTSGALSHSAAVALSVATAVEPDFNLSINPASLTVTAGAPGQSVSVTATAVNGFTGSVTATLSQLPAGVTASPASLTLTPGKAAAITLTAAAGAGAGSAKITVTGVSGTLTHTENLALTTEAAAAVADFSLSIQPASLALTAGAASEPVNVTANAVNGFSGSVTVAVSGLPSGVTASPSTLTLAAGKAATVSFNAASGVKAGASTITFTGSSGSLKHTAALALTTQAAPAGSDFSLLLQPASLTLTAGAASQSVSVTANAGNGFTGSVTVAVSGLPAGVTANPSTLTLTPGKAATVSFVAAAGAAAGSSAITFTGSSGSLKHTASLALTVKAAAAPPDFSLSANPGSLTVTAGSAGQSVSLTASAVQGFTGSVAVTISGLPAGVTATPSSLTLTPGKASAVTLTAAAGASAGASTVTFTGTSGTLKHTAVLALTITAATAPPPTAAPDVTTYHYNNARDGLNAQETILTPANVDSSKFGKLSLLSVDGHVDAEPLFLANLKVNGQSRNVLYVATEHGSVYAFDADTFAQLWKVSLIPSGQTPSDPRNCVQITPEIGITSTPVIDRSRGALYAVAMSRDGNGAYHQWLNAVSISTGAQLQSPTDIVASYPGGGANSQNGNVVFDPGQYAERTGLLLLNGNIYTAWTSHCDQYPYSGWILGYSESTLKQTQVLNITPNGGMGGIWMAGDGLAADAAGSIYLLDGNGTFDTTLTNGIPSQGDYGNAILRLSAQSSLQVADYFEGYNTVSESNADQDLGSGGLILLPDVTDASGATRQLLVGAGKDGALYVADRTNLGKYNPSTSAVNSNLYQYIPGALGAGSFSSPAYFNGIIYYGPIGRPLLAFPVTKARVAASPQSQSAATFAYPGTTPSISASGTANAIVWALESSVGSAAVLHAYAAGDLTHEYYNSSQAAGSRDSFGNGNKYITPLVVNGKVYVGTQSGVAVFGLLNP